jgi:hypothetical protein
MVFISFQSDVIHRINGNILWTTLDKKNLRLLMTMTQVLKTPLKVKFSENVVANYELGIKVGLIIEEYLLFSRDVF